MTLADQPQRSSGTVALAARWVWPFRCWGLIGALLVGSSRGDDTPLPYVFQRIGDEFQLSLGLTDWYYYSLLHTADLNQPFGVLKMALGNPAPTFGYTPGSGETQGFFKAQALDIFAPGDLDGDGIDDVYELKNQLNPLNPDDARLPNRIDRTKTNLQYYLTRFKKIIPKEFYSVEVSVNNHDSALSDEISLYNFPRVAGVSLEAISAEVSLYNGSSTLALSAEAFSDEVSVFNDFGSTGAAIAAISDEVSIFNTLATAVPSIEAISDEVSVKNTPVGFLSTVEAISDEVSVFNTAASTLARTEAVSDEVSVFNTPAATAPSVEAVSAEVSVFNSPALATLSVEVISDEVSVFNAFSTNAEAPIVSREISVRNTPP